MGAGFGARPGWRWAAVARGRLGAAVGGERGANVPSMSRVVSGLYGAGVSCAATSEAASVHQKYALGSNRSSIS